MIWRNTTESYGLVAKSFHWVIALLVIGLLALGLYMSAQEPPTPQVFKLYALHKSLGITVLALAVLRVLWRLYNAHPLPLPNHKAWEKALAKAVHALLYLSLFLMPLSGWVMSSAKGFSVSVFNLFTLPDFVSRSDSLADAAKEVHEIAAYTLIAIVVLHAAGAIKHHVIDKDSTLRRMLPAIAVAAFMAFSNPALAQDAAAWTIQKDASKLTFTATQMGASFEGSFGSFDGTIRFDPANLPGSKADIAIAMDSIETGSTDRNGYVRMADWLDIAKFPQGRFVTKSIEKGLDADQYVAKGDLTVRDVTLPVTLPFTLSIEKDAQGADVATMRGDTAINRLDFGVGQGQWKDTKSVGGEVGIHVTLKAIRAAQ